MYRYWCFICIGAQSVLWSAEQYISILKSASIGKQKIKERGELGLIIQPSFSDQIFVLLMWCIIIALPNHSLFATSKFFSSENKLRMHSTPSFLFCFCKGYDNIYAIRYVHNVYAHTYF